MLLFFFFTTDTRHTHRPTAHPAPSPTPPLTPPPRPTHEPEAPEDGQSVDVLQAEVDEAGDDDEEVEDVPRAVEVRLAHGEQLDDRFGREDGGEDLREERGGGAVRERGDGA